VVKFRFSHSQLRKQRFFAEIFKIQVGVLVSLPTPMNVLLHYFCEGEMAVTRAGARLFIKACFNVIAYQ